MVGFGKYCLIALIGVGLGMPVDVAAQAKHPTPKSEVRSEQLKHSAAAKNEFREEASRTFLHKNWQVQSSCDDKAGGDKISTGGYEAGGWHHANIPATVVGVLVTDKTYPDPNYGTNLKNFPGMYISDKVFFLRMWICRRGVHLLVRGGFARNLQR